MRKNFIVKTTAALSLSFLTIGLTMPSEAANVTYTKKLLWAENFTGKAGAVPTVETYAEQLNGSLFTKRKTYWSADQGDGSGSGAGAGWGNNEKEYYIDEMISRDGKGNLRLRAVRTDLNDSLAPLGWQDHTEWAYLSGKISTAAS